MLFGAQNPDGHLNFTWYKDDTQLPGMTNYGLNPASTGGLGRTYQYFTGTPSFPFGYGLSYTTFRVSDVTADRTSVSADGSVALDMTVTNTGHRAGSTVVQLYVSTPGAGTGDVPRARLAGFQKTGVLAPGEARHVTLRVKLADLALWDAAHAREAVPDGVYRFQVSADAATPLARVDVTVTGALPDRVRYVTVQPEAVVYQAGQSFDLTGRNRWLAGDSADGIVAAVADDESFTDLATARASYASSDPSVATVDSAGRVRAVRDGVATISVIVDGVTGYAVIVVRTSLTIRPFPWIRLPRRRRVARLRRNPS